MRTPPHKVYDLSKANFSTLEQQEQAYVNDTLLPLAANVECAVGGRVFFEDERQTYRLRFDMRMLLRGDQKARSEFYQSALLNGWLCINDVRRMEGLGPIPGGDVYRVPVNSAPLGSAVANGEKPQGGDAASGTPPVGGPAASTDNSVPIESETADNAVF